MGKIKTKKQVQTEQQIMYLLGSIIESAPQYSTAQHMVHFLRKKGDSKDVYDWTDEILLTKIEAYYDELKIDLLTKISQED